MLTALFIVAGVALVHGFSAGLPLRPTCASHGPVPTALALPQQPTALALPQIRSAWVLMQAESVAAEADVASASADADAVFAVIDSNGDGNISEEELIKHLTTAGYAEAAVSKIFEKLDTNKDGELSLEELRAGFLLYSPLRSAPGMGSYNSQFVTEIHADADNLFNAVDIDGNGSISETELRVHLRSFSGYSDPAITKIFEMLDVDASGEISRGELQDAFVKYSALRQAIGEGPNFK